MVALHIDVLNSALAGLPPEHAVAPVLGATTKDRIMCDVNEIII